MTNDRTPRRIQSVELAFDILEVLRDSGGATVTEVADRIGRSPGTTHTYLATMADRGYIQSRDGEYHVGLFAVPLGEYVRSQSRLYRVGKSEVDELAQETGEASHLVVESHGREIPLYERFGSDAVGETLYEENKGHPRRNLHCSAAGKAILAHTPPERRDEILTNYEFAERTPQTTTDEASLREEFEAVRQQGFAQNDEEQMSGLRAVGAPIRYEGQIRGAISLSAPTSRLQGQQFEAEIPERVVQAANVVEINLQSA
ncbi:IclR family transcriptional regulator [Halomicrobium sp. HM KBTZ05]|uniref:Helix-turn-helix domain-containing protein n=1 Tax=Halomicrobium mukohataei TaxID=57705 RepID=A0A847U747_9EURY|nr:IclR family transcriptional regulator [Halomicrobium mukohataei]NLV09135.1 helix-turn-helix domain-containing protein [Halomicrobium mukohataei]